MNLKTFLFMALALPALAGEGPTFGVLVGFDRPFDDLGSDKYYGTNAPFGAHGGAQVQFNLNSQNELRAQVSFHAFPGLRWNPPGQKNDYTVLQVAGDWVHAYYPGARHPYFLAGITVNTLHATYDGPLSGSVTQSGTFGVRGGMGYVFSRTFHLEGQFNQVMVKRYGPDGLGFTPAQWLQGSAILNF